MTHPHPNTPITCITSSPEHTIQLGHALAKALHASDLIFLEGELGAGKTRLVKGIASGLGINPDLVSSPTFVLAHEYPLPADSAGQSSKPTTLVHIDAYRIASLEDLESIGWTRGSERPDSEFRSQVITVIEWSSKMKTPPSISRLQIDIKHHSDSLREITVLPVGLPDARVEEIQHCLELFLPVI